MGTLTRSRFYRDIIFLVIALIMVAILWYYIISPVIVLGWVVHALRTMTS